MSDRDYSERTTDFYDDRDGDVVTTLACGLIKSCTPDTPHSVFFLIPTTVKVEEGVPTVHLDVRQYVHMGALSDDLRNKIREEINAMIEAEKARKQ